jgi:proteic killer suppression protein
MAIFKVEISEKAQKDLQKLPEHIVENLLFWTKLVRDSGLYETRKISSYHDEPLKGKWQGYRSIRLSKAYRAFYTLQVNGSVQLVRVERVNKHEY